MRNKKKANEAHKVGTIQLQLQLHLVNDNITLLHCLHKRKEKKKAKHTRYYLPNSNSTCEKDVHPKLMQMNHMNLLSVGIQGALTSLFFRAMCQILQHKCSILRVRSCELLEEEA